MLFISAHTTGSDALQWAGGLKITPDGAEPVQIISPATIKSIWRLGLLDGIPDSTISGKTVRSEPELWTNDRGKKLLDEVSRDTGIVFDLATDEFVVPYPDPYHEDGCRPTIH
jgi:hypothetical protein